MVCNHLLSRKGGSKTYIDVREGRVILHDGKKWKKAEREKYSAGYAGFTKKREKEKKSKLQ